MWSTVQQPSDDEEDNNHDENEAKTKTKRRRRRSYYEDRSDDDDDDATKSKRRRRSDGNVSTKRKGRRQRPINYLDVYVCVYLRRKDLKNAVFKLKIKMITRFSGDWYFY